jgi:hypothetical protein
MCIGQERKNERKEEVKKRRRIDVDLEVWK